MATYYGWNDPRGSPLNQKQEQAYEQNFDGYHFEHRPGPWRRGVGPIPNVRSQRGGGIAAVAHPHYTPNAEAILAELKEQGLTGMEVYYRDLDANRVADLLSIARNLGLLPTGGSDFHGLGNPGEREPGDIPLPDDAVDALLEAGERCAMPRVVAE